jgi:hypothetical protein
LEEVIMRILASAVIAAASLILPGLAAAQMPPPPANAPQAAPSAPVSHTPKVETHLSQTPTVDEKPTAQQQASAGDPWTSQGHDLDNIADKLSACVDRQPSEREACIKQAIDSSNGG